MLQLRVTELQKQMQVENFMTTQKQSGEDKWYGQSAETESVPLVDSGTGSPVVMRFFEFKADPVSLKRDKPTKQELFTAHAKQIKLMLWSDGMKALEWIEPKVILSKKMDAYRIMVTCVANEGVAITDTTQTLQQLIKK